MRIIHTADWHIGQKLAGYGRDYEHAAVLNQLADIVRDREADALLVSGDVFDHQNPSGEAQQVFYSALLKLKKARPAMAIIVTAGNHDAAGRLEAPRALLASMNVHIVGNVRRSIGCIDASRHFMTLNNAAGDAAARVLAVSYPTPACLPALAAQASATRCSTGALYDEMMVAGGTEFADLPLIVMGHLHVAGGLETEGSERKILIAGQQAVPPDVFPAQAAYVALGHLHKAQWIGRKTIRYSGSLIPLSASEITYQHGVTLLTFDGISPVPVIEHIPVVRPVEFLRVPSDREIVLDELGDHLKALALDPKLPVERWPFVQVWLSWDDRGKRAEADRIGAEFPVRLIEPKISKPARAAEQLPLAEPSVRLAEINPEDLFHKAFARRHGKPPEVAHIEAFQFAAHAAASED
ncbi:MAG: exonuclease subunit SbcD [Hyphomicrobiaceae bacterium]